MHQKKFVLTAAVCLVFYALHPCAAQDTIAKDSMDARIESAQDILEHAKSYKKHAEVLIAQTAKAAADAKRLEGNANAYQSKLAPKIRRLNGAQLAQAKIMFKSDLQAFSQHAKEYQDHTRQVRAQLGECHASEQEFERNKLSYDLHCGQYHIADVAPPHICPAMRSAYGDAAAAQNRLRTDTQRLNAQEANLAESEERLSKAIGASAQGDVDITRQNSRYLKEQELAAEFGTLKEEYRQLEVGRKALQANGVKIPVATVSGRVTLSK